MKGAIILSYPKDLLDQSYLQSRKLDTEQRFMHNRTTSSLQMKSPIVEFLTTDAKKGEKEYSEDDLIEMSLANVINNASWSQSDIMFSAPVVMCHIIDKKASYTPFDINPKQIIIDEFDELVNNDKLSG
jgi:hypothetical protein